MSMNMFDHQDKQQSLAGAPLATRMRPNSLHTYVGQEHLIGNGKVPKVVPATMGVLGGTMAARLLFDVIRSSDQRDRVRHLDADSLSASAR